VAEYWQTTSSDEVHNRWQASVNGYFCVRGVLKPVNVEII